MIRMKSWNDPFQQASMALAVDFNNAWFYCYQFYVDFETTYEEKFASFLPCEPVM